MPNFWLLVRETHAAIEAFDAFDPRTPKDQATLERLVKEADKARKDLVLFCKKELLDE